MAAVEDLRVHTIADDFLKRGFGQRYQWVFAAEHFSSPGAGPDARGDRNR